MSVPLRARQALEEAEKTPALSERGIKSASWNHQSVGDECFDGSTLSANTGRRGPLTAIHLSVIENAASNGGRFSP